MVIDFYGILWDLYRSNGHYNGKNIYIYIILFNGNINGNIFCQMLHGAGIFITYKTG